ncbi:MAG: thioredoxin family protein [Candidatus Obscuribacterales bacterium]|nr:thioredoxin family protein [Candidatus Obscuribacterales bacterium]
MKKIKYILFAALTALSSLAVAIAATSSEGAIGDNYKPKTGETLWGISARALKDQKSSRPVKEMLKSIIEANKDRYPQLTKNPPLLNSSMNLKIPGSKSVGPNKEAAKVKIPAVIASEGKLAWMDVNSAKAAAKAKNKLILADVYTDWCGWCKVLDKNTFHNPEVEDYISKNFVLMKVNAEDGAAGTEIAKNFQIQGFPTVMVFKANGKVLARIEGYREPPDFLKEVKAAQTAAGK